MAAGSFRNFPGRGASGVLDGVTTLVGSRSLLAEHGVVIVPDLVQAQPGEYVVHVARNGQHVAAIMLQDTIKPTAALAIQELRSLGLAVAILSGDREANVAALASELSVAEHHAEMLPEAKLLQVASQCAAGRTVAMVGDGINDGPALAHADVGIALGTGTDVAIEAADIALMSGDVRGVPRAVRLARATLRTIRQNLFLAFIYNLIGIPLAAGLLYPWTGWLLPPMFAAAAMSCSSLSVVGNSLRLRNTKIDQSSAVSGDRNSGRGETGSRHRT